MGIKLRSQVDDTITNLVDGSDSVDLQQVIVNIDARQDAVDVLIANLQSAIANLQSSSVAIEAEQNADFTVSTLAIYPVDSRTNPVTVYPPSSPVAGSSSFIIVDSRANSTANNITIDFGSVGQLIHGSSEPYLLNQDSAYGKFFFLGGQIGWIIQK